MKTPPNGYTVLGKVKDIVVPYDWGHYGMPKTFLKFAFYFEDEKWELSGSRGWLHKVDNRNIWVAAEPNSELYNMQKYPPLDGYVVLGTIDKIKTPKSWGSFGYNDRLAFAWRYVSDKNNLPWHICEEGWIYTGDNVVLAARPNTPLYDMNFPKKKRPTLKEINELESKLATLEEENKKLREQVESIKKILA